MQFICNTIAIISIFTSIIVITVLITKIRIVTVIVTITIYRA